MASLFLSPERLKPDFQIKIQKNTHLWVYIL
jgi:hypothetical protein